MAPVIQHVIRAVKSIKEDGLYTVLSPTPFRPFGIVAWGYDQDSMLMRILVAGSEDQLIQPLPMGEIGSFYKFDELVKLAEQERLHYGCGVSLDLPSIDSQDQYHIFTKGVVSEIALLGVLRIQS